MVKFNAILAEKDKIRKETLGKLRSQCPSDRARKSGEIKKKLFNDSAARSCSCIMFYVSKDYEVGTRDMIKEALKTGKRIVVPVTSAGKRKIIPSEVNDPENELETGPFGIRQPKKECIKPAAVDDIDVVIVPGVAFDNSGNRIGHGTGYYDNFLKTLSPNTATIGLAFDFQMVKRVPVSPHDIPVEKIISA